MKKTSFSFRAIRAGGYLHRFLSGKKNRRRMRNTVIAAATFCSVQFVASAQCNAFKNANAANPLKGLLDSTRGIAGFAFADIDGDGDLDAYVSYYDNEYPSKPMALSFFRNTGTKQHPVYKLDKHSGFGKQLAGRSNQFMQFVDIDGDGDLDYFASDDSQNYYDHPGIIFYKNVGTAAVPKFSPSYTNPLPGVSSYIFQPFALADMDGDGDYDMYACDVTPYGLRAYGQRVYYNIGTKTNPVFGSSVSSKIDGNFDRTYYDWNKDGLTDFFGIHYFGFAVDYNKNIGPKEAPQYVKAPTESPDFNRLQPYRIVDLNGDGAPETFGYGLDYGVLTPVAVIKDSVLQNGNTALYSKNQVGSFTYRWEYNGATLAGATNYYIIPKKSGIYTLYVSNSCGTGVSLNYDFKVPAAITATDSRIANPLDVKEISAKAYPNPFVNTITLSLTGKPCTVKVTDVGGRVLLTQHTSAASLQLGETLKDGTYFIEVWQAKEKVYSTTIQKQ